MIAPPDMEQVVYGLLKDLGGISVFQYASKYEWPGRMETQSLQVDVRASSKKRARDRAYEAQRMVLDLEGRDWHDQTFVIQAVDVEGGPQWLPEPDGAPRYEFRVAIRCHPQP
jgi:hypothetical protein